MRIGRGATGRVERKTSGAIVIEDLRSRRVSYIRAPPSRPPALADLRLRGEPQRIAPHARSRGRATALLAHGAARNRRAALRPASETGSPLRATWCQVSVRVTRLPTLEGRVDLRAGPR